MTQEEKQLLLKDLCARFPYDVIVECSIESGESIDLILNTSNIDELVNDSIIIKPYLRPMSSMTEGEKQELYKFDDYESISWIDSEEFCFKNIAISFDLYTRIIDWFNKNHFDYRGLIPMGLALEAPEGMYKIE